MNHLEIERLSFVDVIEVFDGDNQAQLQDGQTWGEAKEKKWMGTFQRISQTLKQFLF